MTAQHPVPRRGRPRSEAVERAILRGAMALLEEGVPLADVSIERIARTAGVGKAAVYRRWPGKEALFVDLLRSVEPPDPELPGTSVRDDLIALLEAVRRRGVAKRSSVLPHDLFAQVRGYPRLWEAYRATVIEPRHRLAVDVLRRGVERGEIRSDVDIELINDLFVGPLLLRTVMRPDAPLDPDLPARIVDTVLAGARPPAPPTPTDGTTETTDRTTDVRTGTAAEHT
ncbi:TetR/AcrR family transcriptional regulator [Streptomyces sp. NPDC047928]|uniref:TetR/AcrR family transcriptional regulator n=1 Tax=unclassified Streptomyces TaxID=2593676 RepID=UPI003721E6D6